MARWELWERRTETGSQSNFFCVEDAAAPRYLKHAQKVGMSLIWSTDADNRRQAARALWEFRGRDRPYKPRVIYTKRTHRIWELAQEDSLALHHDFIGPQHVLMALIREGGGAASKALAKSGVTFGAVQERTASSIPQASYRHGYPNPMHPATVAAVEEADRHAETAGQDEIGTGHLLLGLLDEAEGLVTALLTDLGVDLDRLRERTVELSVIESIEDKAADDSTPETREPGIWARLRSGARRRTPVRQLMFWFRTRHGVTTPLMNNWAPVNLRLVNRKYLSGTVYEQQVWVRFKASKRRPRVTGTIGGDHFDGRAELSRNRADPTKVSVVVTATYAGTPIELSAILSTQDPMANSGDVLASGEITGHIGDARVHLTAQRSMTMGTGGPRFIAGFKGTVGDDEVAIGGTRPSGRSRFPFPSHGNMHGSVGGARLHLNMDHHPRTVHAYGEASSDTAVLLTAVLAYLHLF